MTVKCIRCGEPARWEVIDGEGLCTNPRCMKWHLDEVLNHVEEEDEE